MLTRAKGIHPFGPGPESSDPAVKAGPRRWMISAAVLALIGVLCSVGALVLGGGIGDGIASTRQTDPDAAPSVSGSSGWTVSTWPPVDQASASPASASPAGADPSSASPASADPAGASPGQVSPAGSGSAAVARVGTGRLVVVPGSVQAPGRAPSMRVRVEVEEGLGVDAQAFAEFVLATLNDPRGWGHGGTLSFARTDGPAQIRVILAAAPTARRLCTLYSGDPVSCGGGDQAVLDLDHWLDGVSDYAADLTAFREYAVNHEVGHVLGHGNGYCDPGHLAPVMVDQYLGLHGCLRNSWPFPKE